MRELIICVFAFFFFGIYVGAIIVGEMQDGNEYDKLPHSEWQCTDVRIDGLSLPLVPVCWEYTRKAAK
jgi:hypothetical protein